MFCYNFTTIINNSVYSNITIKQIRIFGNKTAMYETEKVDRCLSKSINYVVFQQNPNLFDNCHPLYFEMLRKVKKILDIDKN